MPEYTVGQMGDFDEHLFECMDTHYYEHLFQCHYANLDNTLG